MISFKAKSVYGRVLYYPSTDAPQDTLKILTAIATLTGKATVTLGEIDALRALGLEVRVEELPL